MKQGVAVLTDLDKKTMRDSINNYVEKLNANGQRAINVSITSEGQMNQNFVVTILWEKV